MYLLCKAKKDILFISSVILRRLFQWKMLQWKMMLCYISDGEPMTRGSHTDPRNNFKWPTSCFVCSNNFSFFKPILNSIFFHIIFFSIFSTENFWLAFYVLFLQNLLENLKNFFVHLQYANLVIAYNNFSVGIAKQLIILLTICIISFNFTFTKLTT